MKTVIISMIVGFVFLAGVMSSAYAIPAWSGNIYNNTVSANVTNDPNGVIRSYVNGNSDTGGYSLPTAAITLGTAVTLSFGTSGAANIWSAVNNDFAWNSTQGAFFSSKNYGQATNSTILKVTISQQANNFYWTPCAGYMNLTAGNEYDWKVSLDGVTWPTWGVNQTKTTAQGGNYSPTSHRTIFYDLNGVATNVTTFYLGYFGIHNVTGYASMQNQYNTGSMTFYESTGLPNIPEPATLAMLGLGGLAIL